MTEWTVSVMGPDRVCMVLDPIPGRSNSSQGRSRQLDETSLLFSVTHGYCAAIENLH